MTFAIGPACIDVTDRACIQECPVDCIYVGARMAYVNPEECIDCSACEPVCPVEAIAPADHFTSADAMFVEQNALFFSEPLPGRAAAIGNPGGAGTFGETGLDHQYIRSYEVR